MASNLIKSKTLLQVLIILNLFIFYLFAYVELLTKCSATDERLDAFETLAGISSFYPNSQNYLHFLVHVILFFSSALFSFVQYNCCTTASVLICYHIFIEVRYWILTTKY